MTRLSTLVEVLRTFPVIALVAMIPDSSIAAGKSGARKSGDHSVPVHPCLDPQSRKIDCNERGKLKGEKLFRRPFPGTNGRSCASCHVPEDNFTLTPAHVERLLTENPKDPLFAAIDADDPTAETLTFEHLKKGLIRVWLTLPANVDCMFL